MSASADGSGPTTKAVTSDPPSTIMKDEQNPAAALEEDDEFEDFPVEDWPAEEQEVPGEGGSTHLWEESWDDDDTSEDFSKQLKAELDKVKANKS
ncbi:MAG: hypothetical protein L6R38_008385 [Xanthoria sp. 2 TBL-2021]|nr:MAG: hypothetical protein L6R38_008385 [Xanthoria sp. 2 TBL-2021]